MKRPLAILIGVWTLPLLLYPVFIVCAGVLGALTPSRPKPENVHDLVGAVMAFAPIYILSTLTLYMVLAATSSSVHSKGRAGWIAGFLFCGILAIPAYWYRHVWKSPGPPPAPTAWEEPLPGARVYLIKRIDAEWFALDNDRLVEMLRPVGIPSVIVKTGVEPCFQVDGVQVWLRFDTAGVHALFVPPMLSPEREMEIAQGILTAIEQATGAKGKVVAG